MWFDMRRRDRVRQLAKQRIAQYHPFIDHHNFYAYKPKSQRGPASDAQTFVVSFAYRSATRIASDLFPIGFPTSSNVESNIDISEDSGPFVQVCGFCKEQISHPKVCGGCGLSQYCSKKCQSRHWEHHKHLCRVTRGRIQNTPKDLQQITHIEAVHSEKANVPQFSYIQVLYVLLNIESSILNIQENKTQTESEFNESLQQLPQMIYGFNCCLQKMCKDAPIISIIQGLDQCLLDIRSTSKPFLVRKIKKATHRKKRKNEKKIRQKLKKMNEDAIQDNECVICFEEDVLFVECDNVKCKAGQVCVTCRENLHSCPLCRITY